MSGARLNKGKLNRTDFPICSSCKYGYAIKVEGKKPDFQWCNFCDPTRGSRRAILGEEYMKGSENTDGCPLYVKRTKADKFKHGGQITLKP